VTPEQVEAIFYKEYGSGMYKQTDKPLIQQALRKRCWQAVIDAITHEVDAEWARRMLDLMNAPKA
jgi:hypothetical protein